MERLFNPTIIMVPRDETQGANVPGSPTTHLHLAQQAITGRVVNTATRGWVGAINERAPLTIHDAVVGFVD